MKTVALIVAGGKSVRFGGEVPKQFRTVCDRPVLTWAVDAFESAASVHDIIVVVPEEYMAYTAERVVDPFDFKKVRKVVAGGGVRRESVLRGLEALPKATELVAIHDGARPLVSPDDINRVTAVAAADKAAILAIRATDTVKRVRDSHVISTLERDSLYLAQTPQVFHYDLIMEAHREAAQQGGDDSITDDASLIEKRGHKVKTVEPSSANFKITTAEDLILAEAILRERK